MTFAAFIAAWVAVNAAQAQPFRPLTVAQVRVGQQASIIRLPRVRAGYVELHLRNSAVDPTPALQGRSSAEIRAFDVQRGDPGNWFLRVAMTDPQWGLNARVEKGLLLIEIVPERIEALMLDAPAPSVDELLSGDLPGEPPRPEAGPLTFLGGDALGDPMDPVDYTPVAIRLPDWLPPSDWGVIDREREALLAPASERALAQARMRLGLHYLDLGFAREATCYLSQVAEDPTLPRMEVNLALARAALQLGRWDGARRALVRAHELGAADDAVVEGLAVLSLATGTPARPATARALVAFSGRPEALALAVELLQRSGAPSESLPVLEALMRTSGEGLPEATRQRLALRHGDALYGDGRVNAALRAWQAASPELATTRRTMAALAVADPLTWPQRVPDLVQQSTPRTEAGAEALYLLLQIDQATGSHDDALSEMAAFMKRFPGKSAASDVPERFWRTFTERARTLEAAGRWMDLAASHQSWWNRQVVRAIDDPHALLPVARAYVEVGLPEEAVAVMREALSVLIARGEDDPGLVFDLASLYADTGKAKDGLETLAWLRQRGLPAARRGEALELEARLHGINGDLQSAASVLRRLALVPEYREDASVRLAVMDGEAGHCARAVPVLERALFNPRGEEHYQEPAPWLCLARCLAAAGDTEGAARAAREAAGRSASLKESRYATWLAAVASDWKDGAVVDALVSGDDIWGAMAAEHRENESFTEELRGWADSNRAHHR